MQSLSLIDSLPNSWLQFLDPITLDSLSEQLSVDASESTVLPPPDDRFKAFELTEPQTVRVVVIGQDPYHGREQAMGLSFSVSKEQRIPSSLRNILKEYADDLNQPLPPHGDLTIWANRGVLLLNRVLTVKEGQPGSLRGMGWEAVTDHVVEQLVRKKSHIAFILWGADAQSLKRIITGEHLVIGSVHPSPLSAYRGFFGSKPFSRVNAYFRANGLPELDWSLSGHLSSDFKGYTDQFL